MKKLSSATDAKASKNSHQHIHFALKIPRFMVSFLDPANASNAISRELELGVPLSYSQENQARVICVYFYDYVFA